MDKSLLVADPQSGFVRAKSGYDAAGRSKLVVPSLVAALVLANTLILFVLIPYLSRDLRGMYNQEVYADGYDQLAANLVEGHGYRMYPDTARTMVREPGYPLLLAGIFVTFGKSFAAVKLANMLLAFAAAWLITRLARRLTSSTALIYVPALLFLFHPGTLVAESRGGVELFFTFWFVLFLVCLYQVIDSNRWQDYVVSGAVLGCTVLVRSTPMLFPVLLLAYLLVTRKGSRLAAVGHVALMMAAMFAVLSPWIIRNYRLVGKFVPTASVLGISAHAGLYDNTHVSPDMPWFGADEESARERKRIALALGLPFKDVTNAYYQDFYASGDELKFSSYLLRQVLQEYEKSPMLFVRCFGSNLFNLWFRGKTDKSTLANIIVQTPYLILAIAGAIFSVRNRRLASIAPILLLLAYTVALYAAILAQARYSVPLVPLLALLACVGLSGRARAEGSSVRAQA